MKAKTQNKKSKSITDPNTDSVPSEAAWQCAMRNIAIMGGFEAQMETLRFQIRRNRIEHLAPYLRQEWHGWVPFEGCCRLTLKCHGKYFESDLEDKRRLSNDSNAELPSGETAIDVSCDRRGRVSLPIGLTMAAGIATGSLLFIRARRWFIEVWSPDAYRQHCKQISDVAGSISPHNPQETDGAPLSPVTNDQR